MMFVANASPLDSRRDDEAMQGHRRGGATQRAGVSRRHPLGGGGLRAISSSLLDLTSQAPSANTTVFMEGST